MNLGDVMALLTASVSCILMLVSKILTSVVFLHVVVTRYQQQGMWTSTSDQCLWTSLNTLFQLHVAHGWESSPEKMQVSSVKIAIKLKYERNWRMEEDTTEDTSICSTSTCSTPSSSVQILFGILCRAARFLVSWPYPVIGWPILDVT